MLFSPVEKFDLVNLYFFKIDNLWDFSLTNMSFYLVFTSFTTFFLFFFLGVYAKIIPGFLQVALEFLIKFIFNIVDKQIGSKGYVFFPFVLVLFYFILLCNLYGILPFSFAPTSHLVVTFFFSALVWFTAIFIGFYENGFYFLKIFVPNVPMYLLPFLVIIEIISYTIRIFSLALRLAANITSGHVLMFTISGFCIKLFKLNWILAFFSFFLLFFVLVLELGVAFLQAYVFVTLVCIYFNDSLNLSH